MLQISDKTRKFLLKELSRKHRHYHNYAHVCHVLDTLYLMKHKFSNFRAAELAAEFHDIVYEVDEAYEHNEINSCRMFLEKIEEDNPHLKDLDIDDPEYRTVHLALAMIGCTKGHTLDRVRNRGKFSESEIEDIKMFLDADLRILSETEKRLQQFEKDIRKEFSQYNDEIYSHGRTQVLQSFLGRPKLYFSEFAKDAGWEQIGRENVKILIEQLQKKD